MSARRMPRCHEATTLTLNTKHTHEREQNHALGDLHICFSNGRCVSCGSRNDGHITQQCTSSLSKFRLGALCSSHTARAFIGATHSFQRDLLRQTVRTNVPEPALAIVSHAGYRPCWCF